MKRSLPALLALLLLGGFGMALAEDVYRPHMLVRVRPDSEEQLKALYRFTNLDIVPGETRDTPHVIAHPEDLAFLSARGYRYEIVHENLEQFYADRLGQTPLTLMGGYHTYDEIVAELDSIHARYPAITTAKFSIGQSLQGRELWVMKISDNPNVDEDEPEVFYNALIHAREPAPMEALLYFMRALTDSYGVAPHITELVNTRELFFLPCVNPDGYEYNRETNPNGGGLWRKNRRNNGDGSFGVDLNRNFGLTWGLDNQGSSPTPRDETYRGTGPFSEPETQRIRDFVNSRNFTTQLDYHSYQNMILFPWGTSYYDGDGLTADHDIFTMIADSMAYWIHSVNGVWYATGTAWQLLYNVNGGSFDWEYGDSSHAKIFAVTTEVGGQADGFWPPQNRILPLARENYPANLFLARIAGQLAPRPYAVSYRSHCQTEWNGDGDNITEPGEGFSLQIALKNTGANTLTSLSGQLSTLDPYATVVQATASWPTLAPNQTANNNGFFTVSIAAQCPSPRIIALDLRVTASGGLDTTLTLQATVGATALTDNVEGGAGQWTTGGANNLWHITTRRAQSPTHSWFCGTDGGNYQNNMNCYLLSPPLILGPGAEVSYDQWYNLESGYDFGHFEVNRGAGWVAVGAPVTGASSGWQRVTRNLGITCAGTLVQFRFRMATDGGVTSEGWYIDNIETSCPLPPDIFVTPPSVIGTAPIGGVDTVAVQICNAGGCPLTWSISFSQSSPFGLYTSALPVSTNLVGPEIDDTPIGKGDDGMRGREPLDNQGGPDAFGYRWKDSAEPDGPVYNWVEIAAIGTNCGFTADDQTIAVPLPWSFNFYGVSDNLLKISSNGNLHFGADTVDYGNRAIPHGRLPNSMMAVFWDDLSPQRPGAAVYYYHDAPNNRFIVQWDSVPHYSNGGRHTFEAILYSTGRIVYQYKRVSGPVNSCTVGIENRNGTVGLQVVYNANYLTSGLAIEFTPPRLQWLNFVGPMNGTIQIGQCANVLLRFVAGALPIGTYSGQLQIASNDPDENPLTVPVTFIVGELQPPLALTLVYLPETNELKLRWQPNGAPRYRVYSSSSPAGPFDMLEGISTTDNLTVPLPSSAVRFYAVTASD